MPATDTNHADAEPLPTCRSVDTTSVSVSCVQEVTTPSMYAPTLARRTRVPAWYANTAAFSTSVLVAGDVTVRVVLDVPPYPGPAGPMGRTAQLADGGGSLRLVSSAV